MKGGLWSSCCSPFPPDSHVWGVTSMSATSCPKERRKKKSLQRRKRVENTAAHVGGKTKRLTSCPPNIALLGFSLWQQQQQHVFNHCEYWSWYLFKGFSPRGADVTHRERDMRKFSGPLQQDLFICYEPDFCLKEADFKWKTDFFCCFFFFIFPCFKRQTQQTLTAL